MVSERCGNPGREKRDFKDERNWKNEGWTGRGYVTGGQEEGKR